jgi:hypothetical protein
MDEKWTKDLGQTPANFHGMPTSLHQELRLDHGAHADGEHAAMELN